MNFARHCTSADAYLIGFPLKIRGGTASPIRAIAMLDE
jgi:kynurenine formamidase